MASAFGGILSGLQTPEKVKRIPKNSLKSIQVVTLLVLTALVRIIFVLLTHVYSVVVYIVLLVLLSPLYLFRKEMYCSIEGFLYHHSCLTIISWLWSAGYLVQECGEDVKNLENEPAIVLVNHQSTADVPLLLYAFHPHGRVLANLRWVINTILRYSSIGIISLIHGDFFVQQCKETRHLQPALLRKYLQDKFIPWNSKWILVFPEGGIFSVRKKKSREYGRKNGFPHLEHCNLPHIGAVQTILQTLSQESTIHPIKWIIDITMAYQRAPPLNFLTVIAGQRDPMMITLHYRKLPVSEAPLETEQLRDWMFKVYVEKDRMLDAFYKTGKFPIPEEMESSYRSKPEKVNLSFKYLVLMMIYCLFLTCLGSYITYSGIQMIWGILF